MKSDLHMHSIFSDGLFDIEYLIEKSNKLKLDLIAITDHDNINCINYKNDKIIYGIELSTKSNNEDIHLLGYFKDLDHLEDLKEYLTKIKEKRKTRIIEISNRLKKYYNIEIDYNKIITNNPGTLGRPHIAKLIAEKYNISMKEAFNKYLTNKSKAYIPSSDLSVFEGIELLKKSNCLVSLAHPVLYKNNNIENFLNYVDGIEAIYPENSIEDTKKFIELSKKYNLIVTAGSDFHGDDKHFDMGYVTLNDELTQKFLDKLYKK